MTARMVNLEDGSILWLGSGSGKSGAWLFTLGGAAAGAAAGSTVTDDSSTGAIAGGVLGGALGQALSPQSAQKAQEIIQRMCKDLPYQNPLIAPVGLFK
jgi:surface antigen